MPRSQDSGFGEHDPETACLVVRFKARRCESDAAYEGAPHGYTLCCNVTVPVEPCRNNPRDCGISRSDSRGLFWHTLQEP